MRRSILSIAAMATLCAMAACSSSDDPRFARPRPIFSPNGEMLSGGGRQAPLCPEILGGWWDKLAAAHEDAVTKETFLADATLQFDAMDLDHDGFITPSELSEYRSAMEVPYYENVPPPGAPKPDLKPSGRRNRVGSVEVPTAPPVGSQIPADVVDPVMSADKSLSFKVSRDDFMAQANEVFAELDKDHDGRLTKEEVVASCPVKR